MGEAKRRREAEARGESWPRRAICPVQRCRSTLVEALPPEHPLSTSVAALWGTRAISLHRCSRCGAFWEPWSGNVRPGDSVLRAKDQGPCDNCAYRGDSPESLDPETREKLHQLARDGAEGMFLAGQMFACHKGIPIRLGDLEKGEEPIRFAYELTRYRPQDQPCAGFLRLLWAEMRQPASRGMERR